MKEAWSQSKQLKLSQDARTVLANANASFTQDMFVSLFCPIFYTAALANPLDSMSCHNVPGVL